MFPSHDRSGSGDLFSWDHPEDYIRNGYYHGAFPLAKDPHHRGDVITMLIETEDGSFMQLRPMAVRICEHEAEHLSQPNRMKKVFEDAIERGQGMIRTEYAPSAMRQAIDEAIHTGTGSIKVEHVPSEFQHLKTEAVSVERIKELYPPQPTQTEINMMKRFSLH
jgi:hypothetical protein